MSKAQELISELGPNKDAGQAMKRMRSLMAKNMGSREAMTWLIKNYTQEVIDEVLPKMEKELDARAKEEHKLFRREFDEIVGEK